MCDPVSAVAGIAGLLINKKAGDAQKRAEEEASANQARMDAAAKQSRIESAQLAAMAQNKPALGQDPKTRSDKIDRTKLGVRQLQIPLTGGQKASGLNIPT